MSIDTSAQVDFRSPHAWADSMFLRAYAATISARRQWETSVRQAMRSLPGVKDDTPLDAAALLSAAEIRAQMQGNPANTTKLSDLVIIARDERL